MTGTDDGPGAGAGDAARLDERLTADRERTAARIAGLERDLALLFEATGDSPDDEHDPEGATIGFERAQVTALLADARAHLAELDEVADRVATGSYGTCEGCDGPIGAERLAARPTARRCVRCAERGGTIRGSVS
ncbi:TraR/DksA C4-type zinc finger protein [Nitriliruptor alkaliphilus]|uniref:TraR/DksA family transcriptional regulator n=1 Tax=Nitriliruptor alkaliphilus TaxID=427918 RepID=UPI000AB6A2A1|nr:TraR/DksA C4-type zinc finger protein [Nitriliruptor alkaliphilus]